MIYIKTLFGAVALMAVAGCASSMPRVVSANNQGITYQVKPEDQSKAESAARDYCRARNRNAELRTVTPTGGGRSTITFNCV